MMTQRSVSGKEAIAAMFARSEAENRSAFLPYFPIGFPDYDVSLDVIEAIAKTDVDGFEIGISFSDPLADGPTIQAATQRALENGVTVHKCLDAVAELRKRGVQQPMMMMSYVNPLLAYGAERFVMDARAAGADGFIIPDLPPEEAALFADTCEREGLALVFFVSPNSTEERIELVSKTATGFIYAVSVTGITGARASLPSHLRAYIERVRDKTSTPIVLGFGISTPEQARNMNGLVNGFIVASALIRVAEKDPQAAIDLAESLRNALTNS